MNSKEQPIPEQAKIREWAKNQAESLMRSDEEAERPAGTTLAQRVECALIQARAFECRILSGQIMLRGIAQTPVGQMLARAASDRSHVLEKLALEMAEEAIAATGKEESLNGNSIKV